MKPNTECESRDVFVWFRDMILYILLRWKSMVLIGLVAAVVSAVATTGFQYWREVNRYHSIEKAPEAPVSEPLDAEELAHVAQVQRYQWTYDSLCRYNASAPMMKIDFQKVPTQQMSYLVTGARSFAAATLFRESLRDEMLYAELAQTLSDDQQTVAPAHLAELVKAELLQDSAEGGDSVFIQVQVVAPDKELCQSLAQLVRDAAKSVEKLSSQQVGNSYGRWVFDSYAELRSTEVRDLQLQHLEEQETALKTLNEAVDDLTAAEEDYLFVTDRVEDEVRPYPTIHFSVAALIWGLLGGLLGMTLWQAVRYLYCGRTLSAVEMQVRHGLTTYGTLAGNAKQNAVNRWLRKHLQDAPVEPELLWQRLAHIAKKQELRSLYVVGDAQRFEGLEAVLAQQGVSLQVGASPLANAETLSAVAQADAVLLSVDLEKTRHKTVAEELELVRQLDGRVLGVILMKL